MGGVKEGWFCIIIIHCLSFWVSMAIGQELEADSITADSPSPDFLTSDPKIIPESSDSLVVSDSTTAELDSAAAPKGDIETTIVYSARDSILTDVQGQKVFLYGDASIKYGSISLDADYIEIDYATNTLSATYSEDSVGDKVGVPLFSDAGQEYETQNIQYNFNTKKAYITGVVSQQGDAFMHGERVKMNQQNELFIKSAKYTTCDLPDPHYHIEAGKIKVMPNDKIVTGPFSLRFNDVPTPLTLPFGMFPSQKTRASGIIFPTYGEQRARGFYLQNGGYFFALNDYMNLQVTGEIYSKGGWGVNVGSNYFRRYRYQGRLDFRYNKFISGREDDQNISNDFWIKWGHTPKTKGRSRTSASVNAGSSSFNQNNVLSVERNVTSTFASNVSFSTSFRDTPFNMSASLRHTQNISTNQVDLTLPNMSFNMNQIYPFKGKGGGTGRKWLDNMNLRYSMNSLNRITNRIGGDSIAPFNFETIPTLLENAKNGIKHVIPLQTSFNILKQFTFSPSLNFTELWYLEKLNYTYNEEMQTIETDTIEGFNRVNWYRVGASMNTQIYGIYQFKGKWLQAIRHRMQPSIGVSFQPNFADPKFGYYQDFQFNEQGDTRQRSRYQGFIYGSPPRGESASLSFSMQNNLEAKVKRKKDSTDAMTKMMLIENFSLNSSYNFAADSFQLSTINLGIRTKIFKKKFNINLSGVLDPYVYRLDTAFVSSNGRLNVQQRRIDKFTWENGDGLGQLSSVRFQTGLRLSPKFFNPNAKESDSKEDRRDRDDLTEEEQQELDYIDANPNLYVDFSIPWKLNLNYSVNYRKMGFSESQIVQTLTFNGDFNVTPKTKIGFRSGYDFQRKKITQTSIDINRDLHCWELNFNWVPFGRFTSYNFSIRVKSSVLQDLQYNKRRQWSDQ